MAFSEAVKDEVKKRSHFRCCVCRNYFVEIHHMIPEADGGSDDIDNAAPLCPTCHENFGNNPDKRKTIRQMRDQWYELCAKSETHPDVVQFSTKLDGLYSEFQAVKSNQDKGNAALQEMRSLFSSFYGTQAQQALQAGTISDLITVSGMVTTGSVVLQVFGPGFGATCKNCGQFVSVRDPKYCSSCGNRLS